MPRNGIIEHRPPDHRFVVTLKREGVEERLDRLCKSKRWLAGKVGITPCYLSMLLSGRRRPRHVLMSRIFDVLGRRHGWDSFFQRHPVFKSVEEAAGAGR